MRPRSIGGSWAAGRGRPPSPAWCRTATSRGRAGRAARTTACAVPGMGGRGSARDVPWRPGPDSAPARPPRRRERRARDRGDAGAERHTPGSRPPTGGRPPRRPGGTYAAACGGTTEPLPRHGDVFRTVARGGRQEPRQDPEPLDALSLYAHPCSRRVKKRKIPGPTLVRPRPLDRPGRSTMYLSRSIDQFYKARSMVLRGVAR